MKQLLRLVAFVLLVCGGGYGIYEGVRMRGVQQALDEHGVIVEGRVMSGATHTRRSRRRYYLDVRYPIAERRAPTERIRVSEELYRRHVDHDGRIVDERIDVRFLPEAPAEVRAVGYDEDARLALGFSVLALGIGAFGCLRTWRRSMGA